MKIIETIRRIFRKKNGMNAIELKIPTMIYNEFSDILLIDWINDNGTIQATLIAEHIDDDFGSFYKFINS